MSVAIDRLVHLILQKKSLDDCSLQELQKVADRYPYFAAIHLMLGAKTGQSHDTLTSLYFPDPAWLHYLQKDKGAAVVEMKRKEEKENSHAFEPAFTEERTVAVAETAMIHEENKAIPVAAEKSIQTKEEVVHETVEMKAPTTGNQQEKVASPIVAEASAEQQIEEPTTITETMSTDKKELAKSNGNGKESMPSTSQVAELSFEPFHTVDYFASQGIKINEDDRPKDKFGQQLKSFTEWLKTLKKAPVTATPANTQSEQKVERMAAHSITDREVVTEAMAEVWEKQGNMEKAIAIYQKLSLLNPSKSSYFAAKIDHLKKS